MRASATARPRWRPMSRRSSAWRTNSSTSTTRHEDIALNRPLAITMGDAAGIGPEIIARAFRDAPDLVRGCVVAGDLATLRRAAACIAGPGQPSLPVAQVEAARAALGGEIAGIVTAPLHKEALAAAGVGFPGHTELLQAEAAAHAGVPVAAMPVRMMLANEELRTVLVSIHLSLRAAIDAVRYDNVLQTLRITHRCVRGTAGRRDRPCIAVAGLNPHAGEGGLFGREEIDVIAPAIAAARAEGIDAHGPFAPDTVFMRARAQHGEAGAFDVVVAMYHDQGLIPVKYLGDERGVNVTLGLPLVRTSPDQIGRASCRERV